MGELGCELLTKDILPLIFSNTTLPLYIYISPFSFSFLSFQFPWFRMRSLFVATDCTNKQKSGTVWGVWVALQVVSLPCWLSNCFRYSILDHRTFVNLVGKGL